MAQARILWAPHPYKAGFCITDDADYSTFAQVKTMYDFLDEIGMKATRAVWAYKQTESCGLPPYAFKPDVSPTLEDSDFAAYLDELYRKGFEICSHGASAGNNTRDMTESSLNLLRERYGHTDTYIQHSKNADNVYYEERVAPDPLSQWLLKLYSKNICSGEIPGSEYYWGDICRKHVKQIRLFRTRECNTLKVNPSMPYYDPKKPMVQSWFAATRRAFHHCATPEALAKLKAENGCTVLYQYLKMYVDGDTLEISEDFATAAKRLMNDGEIWVDTAAAILQRMRDMHGILVFRRGGAVWFVNTNDHPVENVQIVVDQAVRMQLHGTDVRVAGDTIVLPGLLPSSVTRFEVSTPLRFAGKQAHSLPTDLTATVKVPCGTLSVNCSLESKQVGDWKLGPESFHLDVAPGMEDFRPMSKAGVVETYHMFFHQMWVILRQMLFQGRKFNTLKIGSSGNKKLHSHLHW